MQMIGFLIIGVQRGGTTSLYNYLGQHPDVAPATTKEIHFFDHNFDKGVDWYYDKFPSISKNLKKGKFPITGEATPYYIFQPLVPERVFKTIPKVKLIVLLRNPIDRAFSHYNHAIREGHETLSFEDAIKDESNRLEEEKEKVIQGKNSAAYQRLSFLSRGIYADQLSLWWKFFPKDQFLILKSEEFFDSPSSMLNKVFDFLGLENFEIRNFEKFNKFEYSKMSEKTREYLNEFFKPHNERLYKFLGEEFDW